MERREFLVAGSAAALAAGFPISAMAAEAANPADKALRALMDRIFYDSLAINPERASSVGLDRGVRAALKSRLDDYGPGQRFIAREMQRKALADLKAVSPDGLSPAMRRGRENAIYGIEQQLVADNFGLSSVQRPYPITQQGGA